MSEQLKESLSAAMDCEAGEFELKRVLNELTSNEELRGAWERYHLVRSMLRREPGSAVPRDLPDRLWERIEADADLAYTAEADTAAARARARWLGPVTAAAVAATVALAVVFGFGLDSDSGERAVIASVAPTVEPLTSRVSTGSALAYPSQLDLQRTQAYMLHHAQHTALNEQGSVLPFAKVAAFETR